MTRTPPCLPADDLATLAARLRDGALDARALVEACLAADRHEAFCVRADDPARRQTEAAAAAFRAGYDLGPLQGLPSAVKDLYGVPGLPVHAGSPRPLPPTWQRPGPVVAELIRQQSPCIGKTHTVAFAFAGVGMNSHWGTPRNPWDRAVHRVPGGSSSGSGVSVAEGSSLFALGTDTGGSVRLPAAVNGLVGFKTTRGFWSTDGIVPLSPTLDSAGVLCRSVVDAAYIQQALMPGDAIAPRPLSSLRLHQVTGSFADELDPGIGEAVDAALAALTAGGARLSDGPWPAAERAQELFRHEPLAGVELAAFIDHALPSWREDLDPLVGGRIDLSRDVTGVEYLKRRARVLELATTMTGAMDAAGVDLLVLPTVAVSAPPVAALTADRDLYYRTNWKMLRNTCIGNVAGMCGLTLPVGLDAAGLPVGLQLLAPGGRDLALLAAGLAIEAAIREAGLWHWRERLPAG